MKSKKPRFRLFQTISGSKTGGAESFFERLTLSLHQYGCEQKVSIKPFHHRLKLLKNAGVKYNTCKYRSLIYPVDRWILKNQIKAYKPNIVLSWMNRATSFSPSGNWVNIGRLGGFYNLKYYKNCDWLIANTKGIAKWLNYNGWPKNRIKQLNNFVPENTGKEIKSLKKFSNNTTRVIAFGRFHHNKAFDTLFKAISLLNNITLFIAGDGPERNKLYKLSKKLEIDKKVVFLGWIDNTEDLLASGDIFVCPSRFEPFGNVIIEAFSAKIPVISTSTDGGLENIQHLKNGLITDIDDPTQLANSIDELRKSKDLKKSLIFNGFKTWEEFYHPKIITEEWIDFFEKVKK